CIVRFRILTSGDVEWSLRLLPVAHFIFPRHPVGKRFQIIGNVLNAHPRTSGRTYAGGATTLTFTAFFRPLNSPTSKVTREPRRAGTVPSGRSFSWKNHSEPEFTSPTVSDATRNP